MSATVTLETAEDGRTVQTPHYRLKFPLERPYAQLQDPDGMPWTALFLAPSLHALHGLDSTARLGEWAVLSLEGEDGLEMRLPLYGGLWRSKTLVLECRPECLDWRVEIQGEGRLTDVHLNAGYYSGHLRWGSGFFLSGRAFSQTLNPEPWSREERTIPSSQSTLLDVMGTSLPGKGHWFFTPAPLCYAYARAERTLEALGADQGGLPLEQRLSEVRGGWLMAGLHAPIEQQTFTAFCHDATEGAFGLRLTFEGYTRVEGHWTSPTLRFRFAQDPYDGLSQYARDAAEQGHARLEVPTPPRWWLEPIQCGWGAQCVLAASHGSRAPEECTQANYEGFLQALSAQELFPGTLVIDDQWSEQYGTGTVDRRKWPDLPGFIAAAHARGQRVLLWWKAWDPQGLPPEACVRDAEGRAIAADPTSPLYRGILRGAMERMLLEYGADGLKVDFSARTPSGPGFERHGSAWGVSLLHALLKLLRDEAKRLKSDALVMTHAVSPHFWDATDMVRLNDVNTAADVNEQMTHRARVARAALPHHPIDTDNWPMPSLESWRGYVGIQPQLGIPSLYFATHVDGGEALSSADYGLVQQTWQAWRARVDAQVLEEVK